MKKFLFLTLSLFLFAACSSDENGGIFDDEIHEPTQMVDVWIGMKEVDNGASICPNVMRVPYNPIPDEEWPAPLLELKNKGAFWGDASVCRIETNKGIFYHTHSGFDNNLGGYFYIGNGLPLNYYDEDEKRQQRREVPEGFPNIDGWECIYFDYSLGEHGPLWWRD